MNRIINRKILLTLVILFLLLFYVFSRQVKNGLFKNSDFAATVKIQEKIDKSIHLRAVSIVDNVMDGSTYLASPEISVFIILIITFLTVVELKNKKFHLRGVSVPILFGLLILGEIYGKTVVLHPSPTFAYIKHPISIFPKDYVNEQFSYPSGHAARAVFIAICICSVFIIQNSLIKRNAFRIVGFICLICYVGAVSISRIYLGHHWLSDVIGGLLLGSGLGLLSLLLTIDDNMFTPYNKPTMSN